MEIIFYRNKQQPNYFLLYKGKNGVDPQKMLLKLTNTGKFTNSGYEKVDVELSHTLKTEHNSAFFHFLVDNIASHHISHPLYNDETFKAWYQFKEFEPDVWLKAFEEDTQQMKVNGLIGNKEGMQITLF